MLALGAKVSERWAAAQGRCGLHQPLHESPLNFHQCSSSSSYYYCYYKQLQHVSYQQSADRYRTVRNGIPDVHCHHYMGQAGMET